MVAVLGLPRILGVRRAAPAIDAAAYLATTLGLTTDQALAASTARVKAGTLTISGDAAARRRSDGDGGRAHRPVRTRPPTTPAASTTPQPRATEN